ncbi:MAG TPA: hypothetical protein VGC57_11390 [Cellulomonas sp.]
MTAAPGTDDDDLMDLASRFSYQNLRRGNGLDVNGTRYVVRDATHDTVTGLDAFTFFNTASHEVTVGFQGSQGTTDRLNNAQLVTALTPVQFEAAEAYVAAVEGGVDFVCGNSLGGGLAAYVAGRDPDLRAVTVNPAPVPAELAGMRAPNVHNYLVSNDMLHQLVVAGGLGDRVIGRSTVVQGTATNDVFGPNHVGSDRDAGLYDASMAVPFSLFHADRIVSAGSFGPRVDITVENLVLLSEGLRAQRVDLDHVLDSELVGLRDELETYRDQLTAREQQMHADLVEAFEAGYRPVRLRIEEIRDALRTVLRHIPCPPLLRFFWRPVADLLLAGVREILDALEGIGDLAVRAVAEGAWRTLSATFADTSAMITDSLIRQAGTLQEDARVIDAEWDTFTTFTDLVTTEVLRVDAELAAAIAARSCPPDALPALTVRWPDGQVQGVTEDLAVQLAQQAVDARQEAASLIVTRLGAALVEATIPPTHALRGIDDGLEVVESVLDGALSGLDSALETVEQSALAQALGASDGIEAFREDLTDFRADFRRQSDTIQEDLRAVRRVLDELPDLVLSLRPQLESLIFADERIEAAYDALSKCRNLAERSELAFAEARHQLAEHEATMIRALEARAADVEHDLSTVDEALAEMVA